ncbi:MAG: hypothetical protein HYU60_06670 [Magnetospirillum sp.]|nr:hypothetical protein [Magnetospirillum sp.]
MPQLDPTPKSEPHPRQEIAPGDDAPPGTPGTGEDICRVCLGSGKIDSKVCDNCRGTGIVIEGIGGA